MAGASKKTSIGGTGNSIYNSPFRYLAWRWLKNGMSITTIQSALAEKGLDVTAPVIYNFKDIMTEEEERGGAVAGMPIDGIYGDEPDCIGGVEDVPENLRIKNDGELLDLIIQRFSIQLKQGQVQLTPAVALKAIDMKKSMLGTKYKGQTVWSLMESQLQIDKLLEIMNKHISNDQFEAIMKELESSGIVSTQRPKALGSIMDIDKEIEKETGYIDPLDDID